MRRFTGLAAVLGAVLVLLAAVWWTASGTVGPGPTPTHKVYPIPRPEPTHPRPTN